MMAKTMKSTKKTDKPWHYKSMPRLCAFVRHFAEENGVDVWVVEGTDGKHRFMRGASSCKKSECLMVERRVDKLWDRAVAWCQGWQACRDSATGVMRNKDARPA